ncbi:MAG: succinate dehydrogenase assembly factor 2 [Hyphomicrobiaceae bacterium]|nr:succinate dehydrogenase assembly factor 2 [Hyphomicrobiaceae bacterium]
MESLETRRRRLAYRAAHRGTKELDLILGGYAQRHLSRLDEPGLDAFERLLNEEETELQAWLLGSETPPPHVDGPLIARIAGDHIENLETRHD